MCLTDICKAHIRAVRAWLFLHLQSPSPTSLGAAHKVLDIAELLEQIMLYLCSQDQIRMRKAASSWRRAIDEANKIPINKFYEPPGIKSSEDTITRHNGKLDMAPFRETFTPWPPCRDAQLKLYPPGVNRPPQRSLQQLQGLTFGHISDALSEIANPHETNSPST